jgi:hypothetical protein
MAEDNIYINFSSDSYTGQLFNIYFGTQKETFGRVIKITFDVKDLVWQYPYALRVTVYNGQPLDLRTVYISSENNGTTITILAKNN